MSASGFASFPAGHRVERERRGGDRRAAAGHAAGAAAAAARLYVWVL